jgi:hypothetical protein
MLLPHRPSRRFIEAIDIVADGVFCRLRIWSEDEWVAVPLNLRPLHSEHVPGLGWVGAVPIPEFRVSNPRH